MGRTELSVNGMACDGCEQNVENALQSVEGVNRVTADHESDTVQIVSADEIDEAAVRQAVEEAGYDVNA